MPHDRSHMAHKAVSQDPENRASIFTHTLVFAPTGVVGSGMPPDSEFSALAQTDFSNQVSSVIEGEIILFRSRFFFFDVQYQNAIFSFSRVRDYLYTNKVFLLNTQVISYISINSRACIRYTICVVKVPCIFRVKYLRNLHLITCIQIKLCVLTSLASMHVSVGHLHDRHTLFYWRTMYGIMYLAVHCAALIKLGGASRKMEVKYSRKRGRGRNASKRNFLARVYATASKHLYIITKYGFREK